MSNKKLLALKYLKQAELNAFKIKKQLKEEVNFPALFYNISQAYFSMFAY